MNDGEEPDLQPYLKKLKGFAKKAFEKHKLISRETVVNGLLKMQNKEISTVNYSV